MGKWCFVGDQSGWKHGCPAILLGEALGEEHSRILARRAHIYVHGPRSGNQHQRYLQFFRYSQLFDLSYFSVFLFHVSHNFMISSNYTQFQSETSLNVSPVATSHPRQPQTPFNLEASSQVNMAAWMMAFPKFNRSPS